MNRWIKIVASIAIVLCISFQTNRASGQLTLWSGPNNGNFFNGGNWTAGVPNIALDGEFDHSSAFAVNLNASGNIRDLTFTDGETTLFGFGSTALSLDELFVRSSFLNAPDVTYDNVSLFGNDMYVESVVDPVQLTLLNDAMINFNLLEINLPEAGSDFAVESADVLTDNLRLFNGDFSMSDTSLGIAFNDLSLGVDLDAGPAPQGAAFHLTDSTFIAGTVNVGLADLRLSASDLESIGISVGSPLAMDADESQLLCFGTCNITSPTITIGDGGPGTMLTGLASNITTSGSIDVAVDGNLRLLGTSTLIATGVDVEGTLTFSSPIVSPHNFNAPLVLEEIGRMEVEPDVSTNVNSSVLNFGAEISVGLGAELNVFGSYLGQNTFTGGGTTRFHDAIRPDDPDMFAEEITGTLTFDTQNVILESTSTYFVSFQAGNNDRILVNGNIGLMNGSIQYEENPLEPFEFLDGDVYPIIQVSGNRLGEFAGQPEGSVVWSNASFDLVISYLGGNGNDVTLTAVANAVLLGDVNLDGEVNLLDVAPFVDLLTTGGFQLEADIDQNGVVDLLDVAPLVDLLSGS